MMPASFASLFPSFPFSDGTLNITRQTPLFKVCRNLDLKKILSHAQKVVIKETLKS